MPRGKPRKKIIDPTKFAYNSKFNGAVVKIANLVYNRRRVRKTDIKELVHISNDTFENAILFLEQIKLIDSRMVFEDTLRKNDGTGRRRLYLFWKGFQTPAMCEDINHLVEYYNIDLKDYPIRNLNDISEENQMYLKKYIWKMNHSEGKSTTYKVNQIYDYLSYDMYCTLSGLIDIFNIKWMTLYDIMKKLIKQGKVELGMHKHYVIMYKDPEYEAKKRKWICVDCGFRNHGKASFCGGCGHKKHE